MTLASKLGKVRRGRRKADEDEQTTSLSDEASVWWTLRDVEHAVVRPRSRSAEAGRARPGDRERTGAPTGPGHDGHDVPFSERFTTASLYERAPADAPPRTTPPVPPRPRLAPNHPLAAALHSLGLDGEATWPDVQQAYRARAKEAHPDRTGDDGEAMAELNATYASLRNGWRYGLFGET